MYRTDPATKAAIDRLHANLAETVRAAYERQEEQRAESGTTRGTSEGDAAPPQSSLRINRPLTGWAVAVCVLLPSPFPSQSLHLRGQTVQRLLSIPVHDVRCRGADPAGPVRE